MNVKPTFERIFGPVASRRLGRSLGVDVVRPKSCTLDCVYCQIGATKTTCMQRREFHPLDDLLREIQEVVESGIKADYITLSGSGEPTLYSRLGELIQGIRKITDTPVAILTNGTLFTDPQVRAECALADLVVPSLDAGDAETFVRINRPDPRLDFDEIVEGLVRFREEYSGKLWLEVFLLAGINAYEESVRKIAAVAERIHPDKIQINTAVRPPAERFAVPASQEKLEEFAKLFTPKAEVIASFDELHERAVGTADRAQVLATLKRHSCTVDDVAAGLGIHRNEAFRHLHDLLSERKIEVEIREEHLYYRPVRREDRSDV